MNSGTQQDRRLSGNQIVILVLAICAALVLTPAGVYAAKAQKVKVVGTVPTKVKNSVNAAVTGNVNAAVTGTVSVQQATAANNFSKNVSVSQTLAPLYGSSSAIYLTSVTIANGGSTPGSYYMYGYSDAACTVVQDLQLNFSVPAHDTRSMSFPTPVKLEQKCALLQTENSSDLLITGYRG
jgi:hypothetical protein